MSKGRTRSGLVHKDTNGAVQRLSKEVSTGKYFVRGTQTEVPSNKICQPTNSRAKSSSTPNYDFSKPSQAQDLGDEWSDYAWSADDF